MTKIPASLLSLSALFIHILAVPVFFLGFILIYESHWMMRYLDAGQDLATINTLMLTSILVGVTAISRIPLTLSHLRRCGPLQKCLSSPALRPCIWHLYTARTAISLRWVSVCVCRSPHSVIRISSSPCSLRLSDRMRRM